MGTTEVSTTLCIQPEGPTLTGEPMDEWEVELTGSAVPYTRGSFHGPAEGGYVEDVHATLDGEEIVLTSEQEKKPSSFSTAPWSAWPTTGRTTTRPTTTTAPTSTTVTSSGRSTTRRSTTNLRGVREFAPVSRHHGRV